MVLIQTGDNAVIAGELGLIADLQAALRWHTNGDAGTMEPACAALMNICAGQSDNQARPPPPPPPPPPILPG